MKKIFEKISAAFEKKLIVAYILSSFFKWLLIAVVFSIFLFVILRVTGIYAKLEIMLDLKYNSIIIIAPMWISAGLAVLCLVVGSVLYVHKYKRRKSTRKSDFYNAVAPAFGKK